MFYHLLRKIAQGFDCLRDFLSEWNNHVYFRTKQIPQTIKDQARAQHTDEIFGLILLGTVAVGFLFGLFLRFLPGLLFS